MTTFPHLMMFLAPFILAGAVPLIRVVRTGRVWRTFFLCWVSLVWWTVVFTCIVPAICFVEDRDFGTEMVLHWVPQIPGVTAVALLGWLFAGMTVSVALILRRLIQRLSPTENGRRSSDVAEVGVTDRRSRNSWFFVIGGFATLTASLYFGFVLGAIRTLETTKPMAGPPVAFGLLDPVKSQEACDLYERQMNAIYLLGSAKCPGTAKCLIRYLGYATTSYFPELWFFGPRTEDIAQTCRNWPAFSALLHIPGSSRTLASYALNRDNSKKFRFAAFCALRYLDQRQCDLVGSVLSGEFSHSKNAQSYIHGVEKKTVWFHGAIFTPS